MSSEDILLIGAGAMCQAYAKALQALDVPFKVLGRGAKSAQSFAEATGVIPSTGALDVQLDTLKCIPRTAIVGVNAMFLADTAKLLIEYGVQKILLEKPGALDLTEMADLNAFVTASDADVFVGYNRRFMASTLKAKEIIAQDGGVESLKFDFSEPSKRIEKLEKPTRELETWFYGNSSHVIDLAFHIFGDPKTLQGHVTGGLAWHPVASVFCGTAQNTQNGMMSWHANWQGPGRWGMEVITPKHRLILQPLEKLRVQNLESFAEHEVKIDDAIDLEFKPGLKKQVERFLFSTGPDNLCRLGEHAKRMQFYEKIRSGGDYSAKGA